MAHKPEIAAKVARVSQLKQQGLSNGTIAERLGMSINRVRHLLSEIKRRELRASEAVE